MKRIEGMRKMLAIADERGMRLHISVDTRLSWDSLSALVSSVETGEFKEDRVNHVFGYVGGFLIARHFLTVQEYLDIVNEAIPLKGNKP